MVETSEVVIVGGGAAGCAVAYYLVRSGVKATVVEGQGVASQGSGYAAGGLNPLQGAGIPGPLGPFVWESFQMHFNLWEDLQEETGLHLTYPKDAQCRVFQVFCLHDILRKVTFLNEIPPLYRSIFAKLKYFVGGFPPTRGRLC